MAIAVTVPPTSVVPIDVGAVALDRSKASMGPPAAKSTSPTIATSALPAAAVLAKPATLGAPGVLMSIASTAFMASR